MVIISANFHALFEITPNLVLKWSIDNEDSISLGNGLVLNMW